MEIFFVLTISSTLYNRLAEEDPFPSDELFLSIDLPLLN